MSERFLILSEGLKLFGDVTFDSSCTRHCSSINSSPTNLADRVIYFRSLLIDYFEGIRAGRGVAGRMVDSLALRRFAGIALGEGTPDHSAI